MMSRLTRRAFLEALGALAFAPPGRAQAARSPWPPIRLLRESGVVTPMVQITYGQSWTTNEWPAFSGRSSSAPGVEFNFTPPPGALLPLYTANMGAEFNRRPGWLQNSAGIFLPAPPTGVTQYDGAATLTMSRCAAMARQIFRARSGAALSPIIEFCVGWPGSDLTDGKGGGLGPQGKSWANMLAIVAAIRRIFPLHAQGLNLAPPAFKNFAYCQGGATSRRPSDKIAELTAMLEDVDALDLPGAGSSGMVYYFDFPPSTAGRPQVDPSYFATITFCRTHAPGRGGRYSGRCVLGGPMYPYPFDRDSNSHTGDYGTARISSVRGYAEYLTEDVGVAWTPLWLSLSQPIALSGRTIVIPFDRPAGPDFAKASLTFNTSFADGLGAAANYGFQVNAAGQSRSPLPLSSVEIRGDSVHLVVDGRRPASGETLEVSYAFHGPGGGGPSYAGPSIHGNLCMAGPADALFPDRPLYAWALLFETTIS